MSSAPTHRDIFDLVGGVPLVSRGFVPQRLLYIVCDLRRQLDQVEDEPGGEPVAHYAAPDVACRVYRRRAGRRCQLPRSRTPTRAEQDAIDRAGQRIIGAIPTWSRLWSIPVEYRMLEDGQASVTNPLYPQVICLGDWTCADDMTLQELLVHEMSHVWCGFLCELTDFQKRNSRSEFVLPSGTPDKNVRQVVFAASFAAAVCKFYGAVAADGPREAARLRECLRYLGRTLQLLDESRETNEMGSLIARELKGFLAECHAGGTAVG